jgi:hypothetical protein
VFSKVLSVQVHYDNPTSATHPPNVETADSAAPVPIAQGVLRKTNSTKCIIMVQIHTGWKGIMIGYRGRGRICRSFPCCSPWTWAVPADNEGARPRLYANEATLARSHKTPTSGKPYSSLRLAMAGLSLLITAVFATEKAESSLIETMASWMSWMGRASEHGRV